MIGTKKDLIALVEARKAYDDAFEKALYSEARANVTPTIYTSERKLTELARLLGEPVRTSEVMGSTQMFVEFEGCMFFTYAERVKEQAKGEAA